MARTMLQRKKKARSPVRQTAQWQRECEAINREKARRMKWQQWRQRALIGFGLMLAAYASLMVWSFYKAGHIVALQQFASHVIERQVVGLGFALRRVEIHGVRQLGGEEVMQSLKLKVGQPILLLSLDAMRETLEAHPYIAAARIERALPNRLRIDIDERVPAIIWQQSGRQQLMDKDGKLLHDDWKKWVKLADYPVLTGKDMAEHLPAFWQIHKAAEKHNTPIVAAQLIGGRRFDVWLESGLRIRLPAKEAAQQWQEVAAILRETELQKKAVAVLDMRVEGKIFVTLSPDQERMPTDVRSKMVTAAVQHKRGSHAAF